MIDTSTIQVGQQTSPPLGGNRVPMARGRSNCARPSLCVCFSIRVFSSSLAVSLPPFLLTSRPRCLSHAFEPFSAADPPALRHTQGSRQSSISNAGSASGYTMARDSFSGSPSLTSSMQNRGRQPNAESDEDARRSSNLRKRLERSASPYTKRGGMSLVRERGGELFARLAAGWRGIHLCCFGPYSAFSLPCRAPPSASCLLRMLALEE